MSDLHVITDTQGDAEWLQARIGCLTASRIADAIKKSKREASAELQCRYDLRLELAVERITNKTTEHYVSEWMQRGTELEPMARAAYELRTDRLVDLVGFVLHPDIKWAGASPDGLVGPNGLVEFKVPKPSTHAEYLIGECVPSQYVPQMMWELACCPGREWNDFVSYCPDFPKPIDLFVCRLMRDNKVIAEMEAEARKFLVEVELTVERIKGGLLGTLNTSLSGTAL